MKYIIEIKPEYEDTTKGIMVLGARDGNTYYDMLAVEDLEELNSDYINEHYGQLQDDAYQRGFDDAHRISEEEYQRGLDDAWEAARKIAVMWEKMDNDDFLETFGVTAKIGESTIGALFKKQTANEAMLELEAYEEKQQADNCIEIGDEVEWNGDKYIVTYRNTSMGVIQDYDMLAYDGSVVDHVKKCVFTKTGRHFDIQSILEGMKK